MPNDPAAPSGFTGWAGHRHVLLTTFRRDGSPVPTPVWAVPDGPDLLVITAERTGKVARLRHTPRVLVQPCDAAGRTLPGSGPVEAGAELLTSAEQVARVRARIRERYGWRYRAAVLALRLRPRRAGPEVGIRVLGGRRHPE